MKTKTNFNPATMWQITITFKKGLTRKQKYNTCKANACLMSKDSPILQCALNNKGTKGRILIYQPSYLKENPHLKANSTPNTHNS